MEQEYDYLFKVLLIGDSSVGKTSVLLRYVEDTFNPEFQTTIGVDFKISTFQLNGKIIKLQLWDTAGQDRFKNIVASYYRGAHGIVLAFDITNHASFQNINRWYDEAQNYLQKSVPKLLIGNKLDLSSQRAVRTEDAKELADRLGVEYIETSAKNSQNVKLAFETLSRSILNNVAAASGITITSKVTKINQSRPVQTGCCRS
jgi:small GTP-binding protein domain